VVLAMPFAYRSLDAGLRAIDVRTLFDASRSLGGGPLQTLLRVLIPNLRSAVLSATVLTVALVLGEYTMASLDQYQTFPVWIVNFDQDNSHVSVAASFMALAVTWILLIALTAFDTRGTAEAGVG
jgi:putative spermidine/putrescine transport system permease protein